MVKSKVMSGQSVNLTIPFLGPALKPPKLLTSTSCTYFRQQLTNQQKEDEALKSGLAFVQLRDIFSSTT